MENPSFSLTAVAMLAPTLRTTTTMTMKMGSFHCKRVKRRIAAAAPPNPSLSLFVRGYYNGMVVLGLLLVSALRTARSFDSRSIVLHVQRPHSRGSGGLVGSAVPLLWTEIPSSRRTLGGVAATAAANAHRRSWASRTTQTRLWEGLDDESYATTGTTSSLTPPADALLVDTSRALRRASWLSWWSQVILTTISSVILLFARGVLRRGGFGGGAGTGPQPDLRLSGLGLVVSATSILWTWGNGARLSRRILRTTSPASSSSSSTKGTNKPPVLPPSRYHVASLLRRAIKVGCTLNLLGLLIHLLAAEQIVGVLAVKVLARGGAGGFDYTVAAQSAATFLQPLDILVVQANTNALLSHFASLALLLSLTDRIRLLDPPSSEGDERSKRQ